MSKQNRYKTEMISYYELKERVNLPMFQRPVVWPEKDVKNFLDSIHRGFPFGSLLLFEYPQDEKLSLIDGLQRFSALKKFENNKIDYVDISEYRGKILDFYLTPNPSKQEKEDKTKKIDLVLKRVFADLEQVNSKPHLLIDELNNMWQLEDKNAEREIIQIQNDIKNHIDNYINLSEVKIPYVQFDGDESELATIFEKLNRGGKTLSRFQVFSAQWSNYQIQLNEENYNRKIVKIIATRYMKLNESRGIKIEGFDFDSFVEEKKINLSELCYALGDLITDEINFEKKTESLNEEIGYNTLAIILNVHPGQLHKIVNKKDIINDKWIEETFTNIIKIYKDINEYFSNIYKHPGKKEAYNYTFINYQYLSFFATLWNIKYDENFEVKPKYSIDYKQTLLNLNPHYIYDLITSRWSSTGDKKLYECYSKNFYINVIRKKDLEPALSQYERRNLEDEKINIRNREKTLITFLLHKVKFDDNKTYDFEHVIPRKVIGKINKNNIDKIFGGNSLGNITILSTRDNRAKGKETIYDYSEKFDTLSVEKNFLDDIHYPSLDKISFLADKYLDEEMLVKKSNSLIKERSKNIVHEIIKGIVN